MSEPVFEVRVAGPDDVYRVVGELEALRQANAINLMHVADCLANPTDHVMCVATVNFAEQPSAAEPAGEQS